MKPPLPPAKQNQSFLEALAFFDHANKLYELKRFDDAVASYDRAIDRKPDYAEAYNNRGNTL
ncbi:MAG: tetratricopeptide repeat protein, partial [Methylobacter sp.]